MKTQAGTIFRAASTSPFQRNVNLGNVHPDEAILIHLGCSNDVCAFTHPASAGCRVLLTAVGQSEAILFAVKL